MSPPNPEADVSCAGIRAGCLGACKREVTEEATIDCKTQSFLARVLGCLGACVSVKQRKNPQFTVKPTLCLPGCLGACNYLKEKAFSFFKV